MANLESTAALLRHHSILLALAKKGVISVDDYFAEFKTLHTLVIKPGETQAEIEAQLEILFSEAEMINLMRDMLQSE